MEVGFGDAAKGEGEKKEEERGAEEEDSILPYLVRFNEGEQGLAVWPNAWGNQPREGVAI